MFCFLYSISKLANTYLYGVALLFSLVGGILSLAFGVLIQDEIIVKLFSQYLKKSIADIVLMVGIAIGSIVIISNFIGILFLTQFHRRWMFFVYSPVKLICFTALIALGIYISESGRIGAELLNDYCDDSFERWTRLKLGRFSTDMDAHYSELSKNLLCSKNCQCPTINFNIWTANSTIIDA